MLSGARPEIAEFLFSFFGEGNKFNLEQIERESAEGAGKIRPWIGFLLKESPLPTILPRWIKDKEVVWYAIAFNEQQYKKLGEELMAFVGPSYSTFRGQRAILSPADPIDAAVLKLTGGTAYKFRGETKKIWDALEMMRQVWQRCPAIVHDSPRALGRVLRDFYMALQAGSRASAEEHLRYLQNHHFLDALNVAFLKVQLLAGLGLWGELLGMPAMPDLIQSRRPLEVTRAIIKAVYFKELAQFEDRDDPAGAVQHFSEVVAPLYGSLFSVRSGLDDPEILKCFMMQAVSSSPPRPLLRDELLSVAGVAKPDKDYLKKIAELLPEPGLAFKGDPLNIAALAAAEGDYDRAFASALAAPPSRTRAKILVECAYELQTLASRREAVEAVLGLPAEDREAFFSTRQNKKIWQILTKESNALGPQVTGEVVPSDWLTWLLSLEQPGFGDRALTIARTGSIEWKVEDMLAKPGCVEQFAELLQAPREPKAEEVLYNALPHLLAFFQKDELWPRRELLNIYTLMLDLLVISTEGGDDDLVIFNELLSALLTLGLDASKYNEIVGYAIELWGRFASPAKLNWALDLADLLVIYPCPSKNARYNLLFAVSSRLGQFLRRVGPGQWKFLQQLYEDLGQPEAFESLISSYGLEESTISEEAADIFMRLSRKSVVLYTLTERVAKRVKEALESRCSGVNVQISNDKVGSDRLRQMARNADIFVMATASAKHAATEFIEANRPKELPILRPKGKGSASMLQSIYNFLVS